MRFNVGQLLQEPVGSTRWHRLQEAGATWEGLQAWQLEGWLKLTRTDLGIWVLGRVQAEVSAECSRCLAGVTEALDTEISEQFYPAVVITAGAATGSPMLEDGAFRLNAKDELDIAEALRQCLVSSLPMKPLCNQDCAGICPDCGVNRNEGECHCPPEPMDPRWAQLFQELPPRK